MSTSSENVDSTTKVVEETVVAPEGGWGWVVVFSSHVTHLLTVGGLFSLSVMYVDWLDEFEAGRGLTSWIISVAIAITYGIAPVPAQLAAMFSYRKVVVLGGGMAACGYFFACFATNVYILIVAIGVIAGSGCGFCYLPAIATVAPWFNKKRSLAIGLGTSGVGIGSFVCAPVVHWLIEQYGWRGTLMVIAGIQLHLSVLGLLLRPPPSTTFRRVDEETDQDSVSLDKYDVDVTKSMLTEEKDGNKSNIRMYNKENIANHLSPIQRIQGQGGGSLQQLKMSVDSADFLSENDIRHRTNCLKERLEPPDKKGSGNLDILMCGSLHSLPLIEKHILHYEGSQHSLYNQLPQYQKCKNGSAADGKGMSNASTHLLPQSPLTESVPPPTDAVTNQFAVDDDFPGDSAPMAAFSRWDLIRHPFFIIFTLSNILTKLSFLTPVLFMVDRARDVGLTTTSATFLVSINGAGNVFGRIALPVLADWLIRDRLVAYILCLAVCGLATALSSFFGSSLSLHIVYAFTFGSMMGCYTTLVAVVTVDLVGVDLVGHAYGIMLTFMGLACLVGPPLAGWIFDLTGDYVISYLVNGFFILASSLILVPIAIKRRRGLKQSQLV